MYLDYFVEIPGPKNKITYRTKENTKYVYFETDRKYNPKSKDTRVSRVTIGKVCEDDETKMRPNDNFLRYFPDVEIPEEKDFSLRSCCIKAGTYMAINAVVKDLKLRESLTDAFGLKNAGLVLDLAAYSIITENNAAQYYPDYTYNHPLFTKDMKCYSDSTVSDFLKNSPAENRENFLCSWNEERNKRERIYISYDSTNKGCEAGDIDIAEFGAAKIDEGEPIFNYAVGYDVKNEEPLLYEKYPGSVNDVAQLKFMIDKVKGYGYKNIGFILDRGYFSKDNLKYLEENGYAFLIMVKGLRGFVSDIIKKNKGTFEDSWGNHIEEYDVYGKTLHTFMYLSDTKKRYVHIYYSAGKAAGERSDLEKYIHEMQQATDLFKGKEHKASKTVNKYFHLHYDDKGILMYAEPNLKVIKEELQLCGYFVIISSEKMDAKDAINLYKSRDVSEKLFRTDKTFLGNDCLRVASNQAASNKIFIGFIALIIRSRMYTLLKKKSKELKKKPNYMTVPAAIRELEKIEMSRHLDRVYRLDHAVSKTQKVILDAFGITPGRVVDKVNYVSRVLKNGSDKLL